MLMMPNRVILHVKNILKNTLAVLDKKEKKHFGMLILLDIFISIADILSLALLLWIIQFYIQPGQISKLSFLSRWMTAGNQAVFIAVFFLLFGAKNIGAYFISRFHYRFFGKVAVRISHDNLLRYQLGSYDEFVNTDSSAHIRRIGFQPFEFCQHLLSGIQQIITQLSLISLTIIAIILFNAKLFLLLLLILLPPVIVVFYLMKKRLAAAKKNIQSGNQISFKYLMDALKGYVEGNIYNRNDFFMRRFISARQRFSKYLFESISIQNMPSRFIEIFAVLGLFILIAIANWTGNNDHAALLTIGAFMAAAYKIIPGIVKIINVSGQIRAYEFSISDLVQNKETSSSKNETAAIVAVNSLQLTNISFQYADQPVLKNFSFHVKRGDFAGITGLSGKGKTTALNILLGFLVPAGGKIYFDEVEANQEDIKRRWPFIAYVRQQPFLINDSILRNITLEEDVQHNDLLKQVTRVCGLDDFIEKFPEGMDKVITENGKNISGGQQQRITIARALYKNADLILLDEPFNELDEASTILLLQHFGELAVAGKMIIMITHDKKSLSYCNKIISLDE